LEQSPLADLHLLANELGVDGFRRLRKPDLVDAIVARQSGEAPVPEPIPEEAPAPEPVPEEARAPEPVADDDEEPKRGRRGRRGGRGRARGRDEDGEVVAEAAPPSTDGGERIVEGMVELLANGSGFLRLAPPEESDDDVYISAAQVKRCELVSGDRISGPLRPPRRSERFPSLVRVDTINGRPADEVAEGTRFEELAVTWPTERLQLGSEDPTVKAIEWLTPFGKGSRVVLFGPARSGKSEALRRLAEALAARDGLEVSVVLAGVRPEEVGDWSAVAPGAALTLGASADAQAQAIEQAVELGRRVAARGGDAVVVVDGLGYVTDAVARRTLAAARNLVDGGSLTIVATAPAPVGGETTVVALDAEAAALGRYPALVLAASGTLRPELLVGEAGAEAIRAARAGGPLEPPAPAAKAPAKKPAARKPAAKKPAARKKKAEG
jgi:transcription termination factor Rho